MTNHLSIRDTAELSLVSSDLRTVMPPTGDWRDSTVRVAGVFGPNASGKSNVLHALWFACSVIRFSASRWADRPRLPHHPFRLDRPSPDTPSTYEFDFVVEGVRYAYGFSLRPEGIQQEWLHSYPKGRKRRLFVRSVGQSDYEFSRELAGTNHAITKLTRRTALFLSVAAQANHEALAQIHHFLSHHIAYAQYSERDKQSQLRWARKVLENPSLLSQAQSLLRFADVGIDRIVLHDEEVDERFKRLWRSIVTTLEKDSEADEGSPDQPAPVINTVDEEDFLHALRKSLKFRHAGAEADVTFSEADQSSGTIAWLTLAVPALIALKNGDTLMIDELDASLHPRLSAAIVTLFKEPVLNDTGAQLIFTSHDATLLGRFTHSSLNSDEIWFCEKDDSGATELYALAEFPTRQGDNFERRYLQGRYGAIPMISPSDLHEALALGSATPASHDHRSAEDAMVDAW